MTAGAAVIVTLLVVAAAALVARERSGPPTRGQPRSAELLDVPAVTSAGIEPAGRWEASVHVPVVDADSTGPLGFSEEVTVVPVASDAAGTAAAVQRARPIHDLRPARSHGVETHWRRPLLPSAQELIDSSGEIRHDAAGMA